MRIILVTISCIAFSAGLCAQSGFDYGLYLKGNIATQVFTDPTQPEDGRTQWDHLATAGAGFFAQVQLSKKFSLKQRLLWQQKGFKESGDFGVVGTPFFEGATFQNHFDYLSADLLCQFALKKWKRAEFRGYAGLEASWLLRYKLESNVMPNNLFYPMNEYGSGFETLNFSWIAGLSLALNQTLTIEVEANRDLSPILKKENISVRNQLWTLGLSISIPNAVCR
jgi:hypothetical protein